MERMSDVDTKTSAAKEEEEEDDIFGNDDGDEDDFGKDEDFGSDDGDFKKRRGFDEDVDSEDDGDYKKKVDKDDLDDSDESVDGTSSSTKAKKIKSKKVKKSRNEKPKKKRSKFQNKSGDDLDEEDDKSEDDFIVDEEEDNLDEGEEESDDGDNDQNSEGSGDEILPLGSKKRKKSSTKSSKKKKGKGKKTKVGFATRFLEDDVDGSDDDSEAEREEAGEIREEEVTLAMKEMEAKKQRRLAEAERLSKMTAEEIVAERYGSLTAAAQGLKQRPKPGASAGGEAEAEDMEMEIMQDGRQLQGSVLDRQALLPSAKDATIWSIRCSAGKEQELVRSVLLRLHRDNKIDRREVKSVFTTSVGYIYIEAIAEPYAKSAVAGLDGFYPSTIKRIPLKDMTELFNVRQTKAPINENDWVRITRGPLKGDLARVVELLEGGTKAVIKAVPRVDYTIDPSDKTAKKPQQKPSQQYFSVEAAQQAGFDYGREPLHKADNEMYDRFQKEHYKNGMWFKLVTVDSYLTSDRAKVNPTLSELQWFIDDDSKNSKRRSGGDDEDEEEEEEDEERDDSSENDDEDDEEGKEGGAKPRSKTASARRSAGGGAMDIDGVREKKSSENNGQILSAEDKKIEQLMKLGGVESLVKALAVEKIPYEPGEPVRIRSGELMGVVGKVVSVNHESNTVKMQAKGSSADIDVEAALVTKYIAQGSHVKLLKGQYMNYTGLAMTVDYDKDLCVVLTDMTQNEVPSKINDVKVTDEISHGVRRLGIYELYDLVKLNNNEYAVVIQVTVEKLQIINHQDVVKWVSLQELQGKMSNNKNSTYDSSDRPLRAGDNVKVHSGPYKNMDGTVKHILKNTIWLHSHKYRKTSGIFVLSSGKNCNLIGVNRAMDNIEVMNRPAVLKPPTSNKAVFGQKPAGRGRDTDTGRIIVITTGAMKGLRGRVISATATHVYVELLARNKKVNIERQHMKVLDESALLAQRSTDKVRAFQTSDSGLSAATPNFVSETPKYFGAETPQYGYAETPQSERLDDMWKVNDGDYDDDMNLLDDDNDAFMAPEHAAPVPVASSSSNKNHGDIPWREGVVVNIKAINQYAVIQRVVDSSGAAVRMVLWSCDGNFRVTSREDQVHFSSDLNIVQPTQRGQSIIVVKGTKKLQSGSIGVFEKVHENDYIVRIDDDSHWLRPSQVAVFSNPSAR